MMSDPVDLLGIYLHLARASGQRRRPFVRDRLLFLSATLAAQIELPTIAAYCRREILRNNPQHLIRRWERVEHGIGDEAFQSLLRQLMRRYPSEKAEQMMDELGILRERERETYDTAEEYAAALLGHTLDSLIRTLEEEQL